MFISFSKMGHRSVATNRSCKQSQQRNTQLLFSTLFEPLFYFRDWGTPNFSIEVAGCSFLNRIFRISLKTEFSAKDTPCDTQPERL